jgi:PPK2 family polyphosphate:nucleotide phosphotransferase
MKSPTKIQSPWLIKPHTKVKLDELKTDADGGLTPETANASLAGHRERLAKVQEVLYASQKRAVLIVLQGMDTAGKDGTIAHIFSGVNPQGCNVASFKTPTPLESRHDFLWRCHQQAPACGMIQIFNRSHYEQALYPRVHKQIKPKEVSRILDDINSFEAMLHDQGTVILKFFLHISREEQTKRLQARLDDPAKHWKFSPADLAERKFWDDYTAAYEDILSHTSRKHAPWFAIPSGHKWYRNVAISEILAEALDSMKLEYPKPQMDVSKINL